MGVRLIVEVLDHWKDAGLTAGERSDLIVVAENANDGTRETYGSIHQPYIFERAGKSAAGWKNALGKLMRKEVLTFAVRNGREVTGHAGQYAVYRIPALCPDPPHEGWQGHCTRPERVTSRVPQEPETAHEKGHPTGDPIPEKGHPTGAEGSPERWERGTREVTPTPLTPQPPLDVVAVVPQPQDARARLGALESSTMRVDGPRVPPRRSAAHVDERDQALEEGTETFVRCQGCGDQMIPRPGRTTHHAHCKP